MTMRTIKLFFILFSILLITSCTKDSKEDTAAPTSSGFCKNMKFDKKIFIPNASSSFGSLRSSYAITNECIYYKNEDGLIKMDFNGNSALVITTEMNRLKYVDNKLYITGYGENASQVVVLDSNANELNRYAFPSGNHMKSFGINTENNNILYGNDYHVNSSSLISGNNINLCGSNGPAPKQFPVRISSITNDSQNYIYVDLGQAYLGIIFDKDGNYIRAIDTHIQWKSWHGGYITNPYTVNYTSFYNALGERQGRLYHNLDANGYYFEAQVSPDNSVVVIKNRDYFHIYQK